MLHSIQPDLTSQEKTPRKLVSHSKHDGTRLQCMVVQRFHAWCYNASTHARTTLQRMMVQCMKSRIWNLHGRKRGRQRFIPESFIPEICITERFMTDNSREAFVAERTWQVHVRQSFEGMLRTLCEKLSDTESGGTDDLDSFVKMHSTAQPQVESHFVLHSMRSWDQLCSTSLGGIRCKARREEQAPFSEW